MEASVVKLTESFHECPVYLPCVLKMASACHDHPTSTSSKVDHLSTPSPTNRNARFNFGFMALHASYWHQRPQSVTREALGPFLCLHHVPVNDRHVLVNNFNKVFPKISIAGLRRPCYKKFPQPQHGFAMQDARKTE